MVWALPGVGSLFLELSRTLSPGRRKVRQKEKTGGSRV